MTPETFFEALSAVRAALGVQQMTQAPDDLLVRLEAMYSHRGDGIPTQFVNPDGPSAADLMERLSASGAGHD